jgi:hypothetical protein
MTKNTLKKSCFSAESFAYKLQEGNQIEKVKLKNLKLGDKVLTFDYKQKKLFF